MVVLFNEVPLSFRYDHNLNNLGHIYKKVEYQYIACRIQIIYGLVLFSEVMISFQLTII